MAAVGSSLNWMAWTLPTALFFAGIALLLAAMTLWEILSPSTPRQGLLPLTTSRGDRLFISLLLAAYLHILWLWAADTPPYPVSALSLLVGIGLLRWG